MTQDITARFARDIAEHEIKVLHDDGLYRHIQCARPTESWCYWFELITVPGSLIFRGDGTSFVFARLTDMFEFFRGSAGRINPGYWQEKVTSGRDGIESYNQDLFEQQVRQAVADFADPPPPGLVEAVQDEVFDGEYGIYYQEGALLTAQEFRWYANEDDRYDIDKQPTFEFHDISEWRIRDYDWWFLWACHAIVWGIAKYDAHKPSPVSVPDGVHADIGESSQGEIR